MRFGVRKPSIRGRISARTSWKRYVRHSMGVKASRGTGLLTNPKKALYNRVYNRTTVSVDNLVKSASTPSTGPHFEGGTGLGETIGIFLVASAIMVGILCWIGLSFKWAMLLVVFACIYGLSGQGGVILAVLLLAVTGHYLG